MASIENSQLTDEAPIHANGPAQPETADLLGIVRRGWFYIVGGTGLGLVCALVVLAVLPPNYKASARIMFERTMSRYMQTNKVTNAPVIDDYDTLGQAYVISSEDTLKQVVKSLALADDRSFSGELGKDKRVRGLLQSIAKTLGFSKDTSEHEAVDTRVDPARIALSSVARNLTVGREDVASVVTISFTWVDPVKAAAIVNAVVDTYIDNGVAEKSKSTNVASKVTQERAEDLKRQVQDADRALLDYKSANGIVGSDGVTLSHGQLNTVQNQLTTAQLAMADAKARMDRIAKDPDAISIYAPDNETIRKLRGELLDLSVRASDIEKIVGKNHAAAVKMRDRMEEYRQTISNEQKRIAESFDKDYELASARYESISQAVSQVISSEGANSAVLNKMRELEAAARTLRELYSRMLQQVGETNTVEAQPSITPDARILNRATPPLQTESSKKRWLILAGGSVLGLLLGGGILLAKEFPFGVFRTAQQVTYATGLPCAILPEILNAEERASLKTGEYVLDWPYSRFSHTLRSVWATVNSAQKKSGAKVFYLVSSNPGEGKTTITINLAAHFALRSNTRVLVIDADFHRQSLTNRVVPDARVGFREAIAEPRALANFIVRKERLNLDILPCPIPDRMPNVAELLGSAEMEEVIKIASESYDLVIVESPPIAAVVDYKMIDRCCDGLIFVVEWGKTSQRLVLESLSDVPGLLDRVLCVVLNKADPAALRSIEHYKGNELYAYYSDQKSV